MVAVLKQPKAVDRFVGRRLWWATYAHPYGMARSGHQMGRIKTCAGRFALPALRPVGWVGSFVVPASGGGGGKSVGRARTTTDAPDPSTQRWMSSRVTSEVARRGEGSWAELQTRRWLLDASRE